MKRYVKASTDREIAPLEALVALPAKLLFSLEESINRCPLIPSLPKGATVSRGMPIAEGPNLVLHAPADGVVQDADAKSISIQTRTTSSNQQNTPLPLEDRSQLTNYARDMGWVGMGGSMFPASVKMGAAKDIHTLVINAVECEPGIQIDEALLVQHPDTVLAGIEALRNVLALKRIVLAIKTTSTEHGRAFAQAHKLELLRMPDRYPGGAEKLLVAKLEGRMPPAGLLPASIGYLVFSVASLWALGRRTQWGEPSIVRPLSLVTPTQTRNILVPVGTTIGHLLDTYSLGNETDIIIAGGPMMGKQADRFTPVNKGMNAIFVQPVQHRLTRQEDPCIGCGSCFDVCPIGLHPIAMADRIRSQNHSRALEAQLKECFLCGACSAVCPSDIPLVQIFREGKVWIQTTK